MATPYRGRDNYLYILKTGGEVLDFGTRASFEVGGTVPVQEIKSLYSDEAYNLATRFPWHRISISGILWENDAQELGQDTIEQSGTVAVVVDSADETTMATCQTADYGVDSPTGGLRTIDWSGETSGEMNYGVPVLRREAPRTVTVNVPVRNSSGTQPPGVPRVYVVNHSAGNCTANWTTGNHTQTGAGWSSDLYGTDSEWNGLAEADGLASVSFAVTGTATLVSVWIVYPVGQAPLSG